MHMQEATCYNTSLTCYSIVSITRKFNCAGAIQQSPQGKNFRSVFITPLCIYATKLTQKYSTLTEC